MSVRFDVYLESLADDCYAHLLAEPEGLRMVCTEKGKRHPTTLSVGLGHAPNHRATEAFLWNLLPEAENLETAADAAGVRADDLSGMLAALGAECAGAVAVVPHALPRPKRPGRFPEDYRPMSEIEIGEELDALAAGRAPRVRGVRPSLTGVQRKLALHVDARGNFHAPVPGAPTTAIVKIAAPLNGQPPAPGLVENEHYCLKLAKACGLESADATRRTIGRHDALVVERFDRVVEGAEIRRLHQEDFCQALGFSAGAKYAAECASASAFATILAACRSKILARNRIFDAHLFGFLVGNADAHAKNFALLHETPRAPTTAIAPLYDIVSTLIYPEYAVELALPIGGEKNPERIGRTHFERLAEDLGAKAGFAKIRVATMLSKIHKQGRALLGEGGFTAAYAGRILQVVAMRGDQIAEAFDLPFEHDSMAFVQAPPGWGK